MGFANVADGVRALGYLERDPLPAGPGRAGHALGVGVLRAAAHPSRGSASPWPCPPVRSSSRRRRTTSTHALDDPTTRVIALLLETCATAPNGCVAALAAAAGRTCPSSCSRSAARPVGRGLVAAHSGAIAGADAAWEALVDAYGAAPRARPRRDGRHRSSCSPPDVRCAGGARARDGPRLGRRAHAGRRRRRTTARRRRSRRWPSHADAARRAARPGPGADKPARRMGNAAPTPASCSAAAYRAAADPAVGAVALCRRPRRGVRRGRVLSRSRRWTPRPRTSSRVVVLSQHRHRDRPAGGRAAARAGIPVLEGTRSGLRALGHLLDSWRQRRPPRPPTSRSTTVRSGTGGTGFAAGPLDAIAGVRAAARLRDPRSCAPTPPTTREDAVRSAARLG